MKLIFALSLFLSVSVPGTLRAQGEPIIAKGTCDPTSSVTIDEGEPNIFGCDVAVVTRSERGSVLIQFSDLAGDDGRILGFAGTIEGKQGFGAELTQMMAVERVYLAAGADPVTVSRGTCIMNWSGLHRTGGILKSVLCGGRGEIEEHDVQALVVLDAR